MDSINTFEMKVVDVMSSPVHACQKHDNLARAAQLMWEQDCGALPVLNEKGDPVAMITDRDICMAAYTQGKPLCDIPVLSAASRHVRCVDAQDSLEHALSLMAIHRVRRLPVIDHGHNLIGIVSLIDIVRSRCETTADAKPSFEHIARSLSELGRPANPPT